MLAQNRNLLVAVIAVAILAVAGLTFFNSGETGSGTVLVYGSVDAEDMQTTIDAFHEAYPEITIDYVRGSPSETYTRIETEINAGAKTADVVMLSFPGSLSLVDNGFAQPYEAPNAANWPDELKDPNGYWQGVLLLGQVITYNTGLAQFPILPITIVPYNKFRLVEQLNEIEKTLVKPFILILQEVFRSSYSVYKSWAIKHKYNFTKAKVNKNLYFMMDRPMQMEIYIWAQHLIKFLRI